VFIQLYKYFIYLKFENINYQSMYKIYHKCEKVSKVLMLKHLVIDQKRVEISSGKLFCQSSFKVLTQ